MQMSFSHPARLPAFASALCLTLAASLAGCASKNPLIDEPAAPAPTVARASVQQPDQQAETAGARQADAQVPASGVTTTGPTGVRRFLGIFSPYRIDIQQGNFVSREMVAQLKDGMQRPEGVTREQVRFVLGTPLLTDIFHADRWDYVFRLKKRSGEVISSHVTVHFKNNLLADIDGGTLPTEEEYLAYIAGAAPGATPAANK